MDILTIKNVKKRFGEKEVLRGLDLTVPEHSIYGFVGRNGAGKTTAMKAVLGLLRADEGEILVAGEKVTFGQTATNRHIGYLPDVPEFYSFMTAEEYLRFCGELCGMKRADREKRVGELLELVGLGGEGHRIKGFSRGMKQRLGIAQALLGRPKLLICDEPTSALDPVGRKEILDILLSLREQTTVLLSTHILSDVERICTDVAFLNNGVVEMEGKLSKLKTRSRGEEYSLKTEESGGADALCDRFPNIRRVGTGEVVFRDGSPALSEVLRFVADRGISVLRLERSAHTLEALFMEVTGR